MNEIEIREKVRAAMGDAPYPPELTGRALGRLGEPARPHGAPRLVSLVAAMLAVAIVATLVFVRFQSSPQRIVGPVASPPAATPTSERRVAPSPGLPQLDLDRAQLSAAGDLVTQLNLSTTSHGRTVTLIGAYADSARTVVFFRSLPVAGTPNVTIYDDSGFLNASSTSGEGSFGDSFYALDAGPHPGIDHVAHLRVSVDTFMTMRPLESSPGPWTFTFALGLNGSTPLALNPPLTSVGSWKVTIEAFDVTSTLIHFQAVIAGAAVEDLKDDTIRLTDSRGNQPQQLSWSAGTTVPKSQLTSGPPRSTRVNVTWARPDTATDYVLTIAGGGSTYRGALSVPAPAPSSRKGVPIKPTDYPSSPEALQIGGAFPATVKTGNPNQCGAGTGPSGTVFAFAAWFEVDGAWYDLWLSTDPSVQQYRGPGTYTITGRIYPYAPFGAGPIFEGPVQLTVTQDVGLGPHSGTVRGTMTWTGVASRPYTIDVSGSWACTWSDQLGPG